MNWSKENIELFTSSKRFDVEGALSEPRELYHSLLIGSDEMRLDRLGGQIASLPGDCGAIFKATTAEKIVKVLYEHPEIGFIYIDDPDAPTALHESTAVDALRKHLRKQGVTLDTPQPNTPELDRILGLNGHGNEDEP